MNREQAKNNIQENATRYFKRDKSGKGYICPICGSGSGKNGTGITTKDNVHFTCWAGCFKNADIFDIIGKQYNLTGFNEKLQKACELFGITIDNESPRQSATTQRRPSAQQRQSAGNTQAQAKSPSISFEPSAEFFKRANAQLNFTSYYRGISLDTLNKFNVGYVAHWKHPKTTESPDVPESPRLIIPNDSGGYLARDTRENETGTYLKQRVGTVELFNSAALRQSEQPIFIVEGEFDALSIIDAGGQAVALCGAKNTPKLLEAVKDNKPSQPLIIALDSDTAGEKAAESLSAGLMDLEIPFYRHSLPEAFKDANEFLMGDKESFIKWVNVGKTPIAERESVSFRLNDFLAAVKRNREGRAIPTGFDNLDSILDGGLYPGLYFFAGKTTFCLQTADNIARAGYGVLVFSLEMSAHELIAKSLSRESLILDMKLHNTTTHAKTTRGVLKGIYNDTERELLQQAIKDYAEYGKRINITEGVGNIGIREITAKVKEYARAHDGKPPVVIIDYLQIIAPYNIRMTDKQNTDKAVLELKRLSRDLQIPVIGISSFNRENYKEPVSMASFKESGAIEYSSDVLIGLQYAGWDYVKGENPSDRQQRLNTLRGQIDNEIKQGGGVTIQLKILKHRNGQRGSLKFEYFPLFNYFRADGEYLA